MRNGQDQEIDRVFVADQNFSFDGGRHLEDIGPIEGAEQLVAVFGYWPTFHDAEVLWLRIDRRDAGKGSCGPTLETLVHTFEMTQEISPEGYYILQHHVLVCLRFREVVEFRLDGFNHQNALMGLTFTDLRDRHMERVKWSVKFDSAYGADVSFQCLTVEVVSVVPCSEAGEPIHADRENTTAFLAN